MTETNIENWQEKQKILVFLAHPDDPEFFCGAMIARWVSLGHELHYCLLTQVKKVPRVSIPILKGWQYFAGVNSETPLTCWG